jgi:hypothetical protein
MKTLVALLASAPRRPLVPVVAPSATRPTTQVPNRAARPILSTFLASFSTWAA